MATACLAQTQTQQNLSEARIEAALFKLREMPKLYLETNGSDTIGGVTKQYKTQVWWQTDFPNGRQSTKFNLRHIHENAPGGPLLLQRIVGNGETVWNYDHRAREYATLNYGGYGGGARSEKYTRDLLQFVNSSARSQAAWATKLLREIQADGAVAYKTWMPGVIPYELPDGPTNDPVWRDRVYLGTPSVDHVMYNGAPRRTVVFQLEDDPPNDTYKLSTLFFTERSRVGTSDRLVEWTLRPYPGIVFDERDFAPYTYNEVRGWKPLVGSAPIKQ